MCQATCPSEEAVQYWKKKKKTMNSKAKVLSSNLSSNT